MAPLALLALLLTGRRQGHRFWLLTLVLVALPMFYIGHYLILQELRGWPTAAELPDRFRLLAFDIVEPGPSAADPGRILLWIDVIGKSEPRVHAQPYNKKLHQALVAAGKRQQQGQQQIGSKVPKGAAEPEADRPDGQIVQFEDAVSKPLPEKN